MAAQTLKCPLCTHDRHRGYCGKEAGWLAWLLLGEEICLCWHSSLEPQERRRAEWLISGARRLETGNRCLCSAFDACPHPKEVQKARDMRLEASKMLGHAPAGVGSDGRWGFYVCKNCKKLLKQQIEVCTRRENA